MAPDSDSRTKKSKCLSDLFVGYTLLSNETAVHWMCGLPPSFQISKRAKNESSEIAMINTEPASIFYSYCHADESHRSELEKHLALLERENLVRGWADRSIKAGDPWSEEIRNKLNEANLILLLVSSDFLASDYCWGVELSAAMSRHSRREARVVPVIVRPCDWHSAPFGSLQALPRDGKPITAWQSTDEAWLDVARGLRKVVQVAAGVNIDEPVQSDVIRINPGSRETWRITLRAEIEELDDELIGRITEELRKASGDSSLTIEKVYRGSINLHIQVSYRGARRLREGIETGELGQIAGLEVLAFRSVKPKVPVGAVFHFDQVDFASISAGQVVGHDAYRETAFRLLFLPANAMKTSLLQLRDEISELGSRVENAGRREKAQRPRPSWLLPSGDVLETIRNTGPEILHFSGHGNASGDFSLGDLAEGIEPLGDVRAFAKALRLQGEGIRVVMLSACYTASVAESFADLAECTIGVSRSMNDEQALTFAAGFYYFLESGFSVADSMNRASSLLALQGYDDFEAPRLHVRPGVDPTAVRLVAR